MSADFKLQRFHRLTNAKGDGMDPINTCLKVAVFGAFGDISSGAVSGTLPITD